MATLLRKLGSALIFLLIVAQLINQNKNSEAKNYFGV